MRRLFGLALRNVLRNKWRSAISAVALLIGVCAMVFLQGFINGFIKSLIEDSVLAKIGAIQIHRAGYLDAEQSPLKFDLPEDPAFVARLRAVPGVRAVTPHINFEGMMSNGSISAIFGATAIDPRTEYDVCPRRQQLVAPGSSPLVVGDRTEILIGSALAEGLDARKGMTLIASSTTQGGAQNALDVRVRGMLPESDLPESKGGVVMPLALAQALLGMPGRVTEYVVHIDNLEQADGVAAALRGTLGAGYEVHTWSDRQQIRDAMDRMGAVMVFIGFILALLVVSGIVNTVLMSVYERVREIGTMMAIGVKRREVVILFLIESAALGLCGALSGVALALGLMQIWSDGIRFPLTSLSGPLIIYPQVGLRFLLSVIVVATLGAVLAALYPAWKASRMSPVDALRAL